MPTASANLVSDPAFRGNFCDYVDRSRVYVPNGNDPAAPPAWSINQSDGAGTNRWGLFSSFSQLQNGEQVMNTASEQLVRQASQGVRLATSGSAAYNGGCRVAGQGWLHLLLVDDFLRTGPGSLPAPHTLLTVGRQYSIDLACDFQVINSDSQAPCTADPNNPNMFPLTLLLSELDAAGNIEPVNADFTNRLWYQIPLYDNRNRQSTQQIMRDQHSFPIFIESSADFFTPSTHDGGPRSIRANLKDRLVSAIARVTAQYGGNVDSMRWGIEHVNIGYETYGAWTSETRIDYLQLTMTGDWG